MTIYFYKKSLIFYLNLKIIYIFIKYFNFTNIILFNYYFINFVNNKKLVYNQIYNSV